MRSTVLLVVLLPTIACGANEPFLFKPDTNPYADSIAVDRAASYNVGLGRRDLSVLAMLDPRQNTCPAGYPVPCTGGIYCCPAAYICCTNGQWCCQDTHNCFGTALCCPKTAETCGGSLCVVAGSICCGSIACPSTAVCNTNGGTKCCNKTDVLCPNACCPQGSTCAPDQPGYCRVPGTGTTTVGSASTSTSISTPTHSSSITRSSTSRTTSRTTSRPTPTISTADPCKIGTLRKVKRDATGSWAEIADVTTLERRQSNDDVGFQCEVDGETVPVMVFKHVPGLTDELIQNICAGITKMGGFGQEILLTWSLERFRAGQTGCPGHCKGKTVDGKPTSCNAFPFASTVQGGRGAQIACIPSFLNTLQGIYVNGWRRLYNLTDGDKFVVRVEGFNCQPMSGKLRRYILDSPQLDKRQNAAGVNNTHKINMDETSSDVIDGVGADSKNGTGYLILPVGDTNPGQYEMTITLSKAAGVQKVLVMNSEGIEAANTIPAQNKIATEMKYSFEMQNIDFGVGLVVYTTEKVLKADYKLEANIAPGDNMGAGNSLIAPLFAAVALVGAQALVLL